MLELAGLSKTFRKRGAFGRVVSQTRAVQDISLSLPPGTTHGIVGESGSGKSTLARIALRMIDPDAGTVRLDGTDVTALRGRALGPFRRAVQPVFQDAAGALDPRMTIAQVLAEPLRLRGDLAVAEFAPRIERALRAVDLAPELATRRPPALSGGQRQRIGIARALLMEPRVLILDEPVSALDVSVQAQVLNLLTDLQRDQGLSYLFIGHDLAVAEYFCDEITVMRDGVAVEQASAEALFRAPQSDYARRLFEAAPRAL